MTLRALDYYFLYAFTIANVTTFLLFPQLTYIGQYISDFLMSFQQPNVLNSSSEYDINHVLPF
jgi:hypothetical protein